MVSPYRLTLKYPAIPRLQDLRHLHLSSSGNSTWNSQVRKTRNIAPSSKFQFSKPSKVVQDHYKMKECLMQKSDNYIILASISSAIICLFVIMKYIKIENDMRHFCNSIQINDTLQNVVDRTSKTNLKIQISDANNDKVQSALIKSQGLHGMLGSFCLIKTDNEIITYYSYNPWFH